MSPAGGSDGGLDTTSRVYRRKPPDKQEACEAAKRRPQAVAKQLLFARRYNPRTPEGRMRAHMTLNQDAKRRPSLSSCGPHERCHGTTRRRRAQVGGSDQGASRTLNSAYRRATNTPRFSFGSFGAVDEPKQDGLKSILLRPIFGAQLAFLKQLRFSQLPRARPEG